MLKRKKPGRPALDKEILESAMKLVGSGTSPTNTARQLHIGRSTLYREIKYATTVKEQETQYKYKEILFL